MSTGSPLAKIGGAGLDPLLGDLDVDAPDLVFELEEDDSPAAVLEDAIAVVLDHAGHAHLGPLRLARRARWWGHVEAAQLFAVPIERVTRDVKAERLLFALQRVPQIPRIARRIFVGLVRGGSPPAAVFEQRKERRLAALAIFAGAARALEGVVDRGVGARAGDAARARASSRTRRIG